MKKLFLILSLLLVGCQEPLVQAGLEKGVEFVSTNLPIVFYDAENTYSDGDVYVHNHKTYEVHTNKVLKRPVSDYQFEIGNQKLGASLFVSHNGWADYDFWDDDTGAIVTGRRTYLFAWHNSDDSERTYIYVIRNPNNGVYTEEVETLKKDGGGAYTILVADSIEEVTIHPSYEGCQEDDLYYHKGGIYKKLGDMEFEEYYDSTLSSKIISNVEFYLLPFDTRSVSKVVSSSPLEYEVKTLTSANAFVVGGVAEKLTYSIEDDSGVEIVGGTELTLSPDIGDSDFPQYDSITKSISFPNKLPAGTHIKIKLENATGSVELGTIAASQMRDNGTTSARGMTISGQNYNTIKADAFGEIEEGNKPIVEAVKVTVTASYSDIQILFSRLRGMIQKYSVFDITDSTVTENEYSLPMLVIRGMVLSREWNISVDDSGRPTDTQRITISIQEVI